MMCANRRRTVTYSLSHGLHSSGSRTICHQVRTSRKPRESKNLLMKEMMRVRVSKMPRTWLFMIRSRYRCRYLVSCSPKFAVSQSFWQVRNCILYVHAGGLVNDTYTEDSPDLQGGVSACCRLHAVSCDMRVRSCICMRCLYTQHPPQPS